MGDTYDTSQYISIFLSEAEDQLEKIEQALLELEKESDNKEVLNEMFRYFHTLKGSSAAMGFTLMSEVAHKGENILDKIRKGEMEVTSDIVDLMFECLDTLNAMKDMIENGEEPVMDVDELLEKLEKAASGAPSSSTAKEKKEEPKGEEVKKEPQEKSFEGEIGIDLNEYDKLVLEEAEQKGLNIYYIEVALSPETLMKAVRAFMVFNKLKEMGEVVKSVPDASDLEAEKFDRDFKLIFISKEDEDTVYKAIANISEIEKVQVKPIKAKEAIPKKEHETQEEKMPSKEEEEKEQKTKKVEKTAQPQAQTKTAKDKAQAKPQKKQEHTIRVSIEKLDVLLNLVGELVIDRSKLAQIGEILEAKYRESEISDELRDTVSHIERIANDLQENIMKARMLPIGQLFSRFPRMMRDLSRKMGKKINFIMSGEDTELDRTVIEEMGDLLIHLLRNAVDHGIEPEEERIANGKDPVGTIKLSARHEESHIIIEIEDDGRGINPEKIKEAAIRKGFATPEELSRLSDEEIINFIFLPGFSSAKKVTDVSGRGVGLDAVKDGIERLKGQIEVESVPGKGSKFILKLPLTLAIIKALLVEAIDITFAIPLISVEEIIRIKNEEIPSRVKMVKGHRVIKLRGMVLPLVSMGEIFDMEDKEKDPDRMLIVVVKADQRKLGIIVDELIGGQDVVIKSLGAYLGKGRLFGKIPGLAGSTILGSGKVALILDIATLVKDIEKKTRRE